MDLKEASKTLFIRYLGRVPIQPIKLKSRDSFIAHLEDNATRVENVTSLKRPWYGNYGGGYFFFQNANSVMIRFKWRVRRSSWRFVGTLNDESPDCFLEGQFKVSAFQEGLSIFALILAAIGLLITAYFYAIGHPDQLTWAPKFMYLPIIMFVVRWIGSGEMNIGHNVISAVKALFEFYETSE